MIWQFRATWSIAKFFTAEIIRATFIASMSSRVYKRFKIYFRYNMDALKSVRWTPFQITCKERMVQIKVLKMCHLCIPETRVFLCSIINIMVVVAQAPHWYTCCNRSTYLTFTYCTLNLAIFSSKVLPHITACYRYASETSEFEENLIIIPAIWILVNNSFS